MKKRYLFPILMFVLLAGFGREAMAVPVKEPMTAKTITTTVLQTISIPLLFITYKEKHH